MFNSKNDVVNTPVRTEMLMDEEIEETDGSIDDAINELETIRRETSTYTTSHSSNDFEPFSNMDRSMVLGVTIASFVIACLVFVFLIQKKKAPRGRFMRWLREFLNFRSIMIAGIIKFLYVFLAVALTISSVIVMFQGRDDTVLMMILVGLAMLIIGNIVLRITMEMTMAIISMWDNTSDIRGVLVKEEEMPEEKMPKEPEMKKGPEVELPAEEQPATTSEATAEQPTETQSAQTTQPEPKSPETVQPETSPAPTV